MPFVRVTCGLVDKGTLMDPSTVDDFIRSKKSKVTKDWYVSPYLYGEEVLEYWETNGKSLKGYHGPSWTDHLYWDLDIKGEASLGSVQKEAIKLVNYLVDQNMADGLEVYFSGNKGFHVILRTEETFVREELTLVASGIIKAAGVSTNCFDTSVYNTTRILRYPLTVHQESQLFKIPLDWDQLTGPVEGILSLAQTTQPLIEVGRVSVQELKTRLTDKAITTISAQDLTAKDVIAGLGSIAYDNNGQAVRRCVEALQQGDFGAGERHAALMRVAAYHQGLGASREELEAIFEETLKLRAEKHPTAPSPDEEDNKQILNSVFAPGWQGGMFTCKTDAYLQSKCENNGHHCWEERKKTEALGKGIIKIGSLLRTYVEYGDEAHEDYPRIGIPSLDKEIRIRPKNYSIVAGASGCVDKDTEFLSAFGWKKISDYKDGDQVAQYNPDTDLANFVYPEAYIKLPCNEFIAFETKYGLDQRLCEEHKVLTYSRKNGKPSVMLAKEMEAIHISNSHGFTGKFKQAFHITGTTGLDISDDLLRVTVACIADGHYPDKTNHCVIRLKKFKKKQRLERLLESAGISYTKIVCNGVKEGYHRYSFYTPLRDKIFDSKYYQSTHHQLEIIVEEAMYWDGCISENSISSNVKETADFLQYAYSATGRKSSITTFDRRGQFRGDYERKTIDYTIHTTNVIYASMGGGANETKGGKLQRVKSEDGFKYCFTVPSGFLVLRRNNKIFLTGNCGKTSLILQMMDELNAQKIPHLFFSLDMADTSVFEKLAARHTPYSLGQIEKAFSKHTRDTRLIEEISKQLSDKFPHTYFDFTSSASMEYIEVMIKKLNKDLGDNPIKVVFIDYAGRLAGGGENAYAKATANSLKANDVAKATSVHIMFLAQVARESGDLTTPLLSARVAKESGSWEENATFVLTCWRPFGANNLGPDTAFAIYVGKNRSNSLKEMHFYWEGKTGSIRQMNPVEYDEYVRECEKHKIRKPPAGDHPLGISHTPTAKTGSSRIKIRVPDEDKKSAIAEGKDNARDPHPSPASDTVTDDFEEELSGIEYRGRSSAFRPRG